jgi:mono/diheme cytochrome c family protein
MASRSKAAAGRTLAARHRLIFWIIGGVILAAAFGAAAFWVARGDPGAADADDPAQVALGRGIYAARCAACHGADLEGQPNWQERNANGRLPAPPHDESGHTWHHPDDQLFGLVKNGLTPYAGPDYQSDMPAFADTLSDREIWAVLAYIESTWPERIQKLRAERLGRSPQ